MGTSVRQSRARRRSEVGDQGMMHDSGDRGFIACGVASLAAITGTELCRCRVLPGSVSDGRWCDIPRRALNMFASGCNMIGDWVAENDSLRRFWRRNDCAVEVIVIVRVPSIETLPRHMLEDPDKAYTTFDNCSTSCKLPFSAGHSFIPFHRVILFTEFEHNCNDQHVPPLTQTLRWYSKHITSPVLRTGDALRFS